MKVNNWDRRNISDQDGKIAIITGSNSGIGFETARVLAGKGATVILAVRNIKKGNEACAKIESSVKNADVNVMELDLASLASVEQFAGSFKENYLQLDLLVNNAGVMTPPYSKTADGFELQFGTNHLGHFALTGRLFDMILNNHGSRVVNVSSIAHRIGRIDFDDLAWNTRPYKKWQSHGDSKIANLYFTYELERRYGNSGRVIFAASHPGWTATELQRYHKLTSSLNCMAQKISMGALPSLYAATANDVENGDFFGPGGLSELKGYPKKVRSNVRSGEVNTAERLWRVSEELTGVKYPTSAVVTDNSCHEKICC